ncbi:FAD/NAD-P-binding domain-containing protein [Epithele typhae]|uniref:FAD/NAD-P-binding domain-containing protein n=1 Tax=Epithele typhae TaxID=378194 RepID=UPI002008565B|nr:FAD/NAD-P-binding domain-containing protein [Epithele typhae]KAH9929024.1 FAD/NAD-P-binding domain-containing protein [Epithele typhae]
MASLSASLRRAPTSTLRSSSTTTLSARETRTYFSSATTGKPRLVILGSGWGGYEVLRAVDKKRWNVIVVSPNNYFNFTPLLASCAVGTLEFRAAIEPVRRYTPQVSAYTAWCDSIDFKHKKLLCTPATAPTKLGESHASTDVNEIVTKVSANSDKFELTYDKLVIAVGAYNQTFNVPGVKEHAYFLKDIRDARRIRSRVLECFEQANQPTITDSDRRKLLNFCVIGGGPTGVEFSAELHDLMHTEMTQHYPALAKMAKINLYDVAPNILGGFDAGLQEYAVSKFKREGIRLLTQHHVERIEKDRMFVTEEGEVNFGMLVWSTGLAPNPLIESITEAKKTNRSLLTTPHLNVVMRAPGGGVGDPDAGVADPDVFAIGDAASVARDPLPATAQVANQQAVYLTRRLNALVGHEAARDAADPPFEFRNAGSLAYIGGWEAVFDRTRAASGPRGKESGRLAWLLWRSAYFTQTLSVRNKILVPVYWFINWIFGRDLSRF